jgi:hypothetical protein
MKLGQSELDDLRGSRPCLRRRRSMIPRRFLTHCFRQRTDFSNLGLTKAVVPGFTQWYVSDRLKLNTSLATFVAGNITVNLQPLRKVSSKGAVNLNDNICRGKTDEKVYE